MTTPSATPTPTPTPTPTHDGTDLGLGKVVVQSVRGRFLDREGRPTSHKYGLGAQRAARFYFAALGASWPQFIAGMMGAILLLNGCFALAYVALGAAALGGADQMGLADPFMRAFAFSIAVFTTSGTGGVHAVGSTATWLVIIESLVGPLTLVVAFGLVVARITRPRMVLGFSESAVVAPYEGGRGLMFRMVNLRPGELSDVQVRVNLVWFEDLGGVRERNIHQLELERSSVEMFTLHWTVVHPITAASPLAGVTPEALAAAQAEFLVFVTAHEETFSTRVTTRTSYVWDELRWDVKFASIFANGPDGAIAIDVERLSRTERLEENATRAPAPLERST